VGVLRSREVEARGIHREYLRRLEQQGLLMLKGALLFTLWGNEPHRATRDLNLLCQGDNVIADLEQVFQDICQTQVEDDTSE
jgi:hypothetical protein